MQHNLILTNVHLKLTEKNYTNDKRVFKEHQSVQHLNSFVETSARFEYISLFS